MKVFRRKKEVTYEGLMPSNNGIRHLHGDTAAKQCLQNSQGKWFLT